MGVLWTVSIQDTEGEVKLGPTQERQGKEEGTVVEEKPFATNPTQKVKKTRRRQVAGHDCCPTSLNSSIYIHATPQKAASKKKKEERKEVVSARQEKTEEKTDRLQEGRVGRET